MLVMIIIPVDTKLTPDKAIRELIALKAFSTRLYCLRFTFHTLSKEWI